MKAMTTNIPTLAIYFPSLENLGGIERVVEAQTLIFAKHGIHVLLVTEQPVGKLRPSLENYCRFACLSRESSRKDQWEKIIREHRPSLVILHGAFYAAAMETAAILRPLPVKTILNIHFSFPTPLYLTGDEGMYDSHLEPARLCDAVAVVSGTDRRFWTALGCRAHYVQNPVRHAASAPVPTPPRSRRTLLWLGRPMEPKMPEEALYIMAELLPRVPDARLVMAGGHGAESGKLLQLTKALGISSSVTFIPEQADVEPLYAESGIHLLTSQAESFCLVLAEAKARGIPTVMYDIPYLELLHNRRGVSVLPYGDRRGMADRIAALMLDEELYARQSEQARESLLPFNDEAVFQTWNAIFSDLAGQEAAPEDIREGQQAEEDLRLIVSEMYRAWSYRMEKDLWKIEFWNNLEKMLGTSAAARLRRWGEALFQRLKKLKRSIK